MAATSDEHPCPICNAPSDPYCQKTRFDTTWEIFKCSQCGHGFVANRPSLQRLSEIYAADVNVAMEPQSDEELQRRPDAIEVTRLIARTTPQRSACLDVGSGNGAFSYHLQKQGFKPTMIDLDPRAEDAAARIPGSTFRLCPFEDIAGEGAFSCIMMSQTLEHAIDPLDWLRRARRLLTSGGVLSVSVPNFGGLYKILGERDPFLTPPIHLNFFTAKSLTLAMQSAGLRVVKMRSQSRVAIAGTVGKSVAAVWNQFARLLGPTSRGIVLICLAQPE